MVEKIPFEFCCQGPGSVCSMDYVLYLSETHCYRARENLGQGTNNIGEFETTILMKSSHEKVYKYSVYLETHP